MKRFVAFALAFTSFSLIAKNTRFEFRDALGRDLILMTSDSPMEKTIFLNTTPMGYLELDLENLAGGFKGEIQFDLRVIETGLQSKNDFYKEKFFNASQFPVGTLTLSKWTTTGKSKLADGVALTGKCQGELNLKGVSKPLSLLVKLTYFKESPNTKTRGNGNLLKLATQFDLDLEAFGITVPQNLKYKMARYLKTDFDLLGSDAPYPPLK